MYDVIIVGGGPAGLSAALVLGRCRRSVVVLDDGHPRNERARELHGVLGHDGIPPAELLAAGRREIERYGVELVHERVTEAKCLGAGGDQPHKTAFLALTASGRRLRGRKLLLTTGMRDCLPEIPGLDECYGISVHHCPYCDGWEHRDRRLVAIGDAPQKAAGLALMLRSWSDQVTALTNGKPLDDAERQRLERNAIRLRGERIARLVCNDGQLRQVEFDSGDPLPADALFFNTECLEQSHLPRMLGCEYKDGQRTRTSEKQQTSVPGLFLAGDADGDVQFVSVAAAEGAKAAVAVNRELQDEDRC